MPKVLVVSDSHGLTTEIEQIVARHQVDAKIHCGDSELSSDTNHIENFIVVRGNCDRDSSFPEEEIMDIGGLRIFVTHGHLFQVKSSLLQLQYRAKEVEADIVLFGHSHVTYLDEHDGQIFLNPGSIRSPRYWKTKTYCIVSWDNLKEITVIFYDVEGNVVDHFPFEQTFQI